MRLSSTPLRLALAAALYAAGAGGMLLIALVGNISADSTPLPPNTSTPSGTSQTALFPVLFPEAPPVRLIIPSIGLDTMIEQVGINEKGEMDVPDGATQNVGWYKYGPRPGELGSAVIDAHVYAAFEDLRYLLPGGDVYVMNADGTKLHFVVTESMIYPLAQVPAQLLFQRNDAPRLNLITCAGKPTRDGSTYTHRLIAYTVLAN